MASDGNTECEENYLGVDTLCKHNMDYTTALVCKLSVHKVKYCFIRIR